MEKSYPSATPAYSTPPQQYYTQPHYDSPMMGQHAMYTPSMIASPQKPREYDQSLFGCFDDCGICIFGTFFGQCLVASNTYDLTQSYCASCLSCLFSPIGVIYNRIQIQEKYNIEESGCETFVAVLCCGSCANCQDAHEIHFQQKRAAAAVATIAAPTPIYAPNSHPPMYRDTIQESAPYKV